MGSCWNHDAQNHGPGGVREPDGQSFGYPVTFIDVAGNELHYHHWSKQKLKEDTLHAKVLMTGQYKFGANKLPVLCHLHTIIRHLEQHYNLICEMSNMSSDEKGKDQQRQEDAASYHWHVRFEPMSKERKLLVLKFSLVMCQYYSGLAMRHGKHNLYSYPIRFRDKEHNKLERLPNLADPDEEVLLSGFCSFGANEISICHNIELMLRYLETRYGLQAG